MTFRDLAAAAEEEPITQLHNVRFVNCRHTPSAVAGVLKRRFRDTDGSPAGYDFQALDYVSHDLVFQARVHIFGIFAKDDHVDHEIHVAGLHSR